MNHLLLFLICILSVEVFIQFRFFSLLGSMLVVTKKITQVIPQDKISDHWKEKIIPVYSFRMMKYSLQIFLLLLLIISLIITADFFLNNFLSYTLTLTGVIESVIFASGYFFIRQVFIK